MFELTITDFANIVTKACKYCGCMGDPLNGVDRRNNLLWYILANCVPSCWQCNSMKGTLAENEFIGHAVNMASYLGLGTSYIIIPVQMKEYYNGIMPSFSEYQSRAANRRLSPLEFTLTKQEFYDIVRNACAMCGKVNSKTHHNGVDRMDSDIGYIPSNCQCSCFNCNQMKGVWTMTQVKEKLTLIHSLHGVKMAQLYTSNKTDF